MTIYPTLEPLPPGNPALAGLARYRLRKVCIRNDLREVRTGDPARVTDTATRGLVSEELQHVSLSTNVHNRIHEQSGFNHASKMCGRVVGRSVNRKIHLR